MEICAFNITLTIFTIAGTTVATANPTLFGTDVHTTTQRAATFTEIGSGASGHFR